MSEHPFYWLDVFAESPLAGNSLAVVLEADGLDDERMLAFARETGLSETTFVQAPSEAVVPGGADYRNRIRTINAEVPFAGHPSLGTAVAVALSRGEEGITYVQETGVGTQEVDVSRDGESWLASVHQERAEFGELIGPERAAAMLGLDRGQLHPQYSGQLVSTGFPTLLLPLASESALAAAAPVRSEFEKFDFGDLAVNVYPFVFDVPTRTARSRCFALDLGDFEDPATGSAAGPLVAYLQDILDVDRISVRQGIEMGSPSLIEARMDAGRPRVSGLVHLIMSGKANLPD